MNKVIKLLAFLSCFLINDLIAQTDKFQEETIPALLDLKEFIALPNNGLNPLEIQKNIEWLENAFTKRGFKTQQLTNKGNPLLFAEFKVSSALPTVLFYMHLDGQAVDGTKWNQTSPYQAVLKRKHPKKGWESIPWEALNNAFIDPDWRIFGRSASDDKGPIIGFLHSMDLLQKNNQKPIFNIKVILDSEEEMGSKYLAEAVAQYQGLLSADALLINDGPVHTSGQPTLIFGCRGITRVDLTIFGASKPQHSGHYGNYAPNPNFRMAHLLASMKDEAGRVIIDGYYDGIAWDSAATQTMSAVPDKQATILNLLEIAEPETVGNNYQESLQFPSLNVRGMSSGWVGSQARTIVPDKTTAAIDIRLVPESDPERLKTLIKKHIIEQGYHVVTQEPSLEERKKYPKICYFYSGNNTLPFRTDMDSETGKWLERALKKEYRQNPVKIRIMGGTVPIASFVRQMKIPAIIVPMVNSDNNQHSPNENLKVQYLTNSMRTFYAIMTTPFEAAAQKE